MAMPRREFPDGLVLDAHKRQALGAPILDLARPERLVLALDQGSGSALEPVVTVGGPVAVGTAIARPRDEFGTTLHSPVSGRIAAIEPREAACDAGTCLCIEVENDGLDTVDPSLVAEDAFALDPIALIDRLRDAGIAGLGGAAFPTATKLATGRDRGARRLLINAAECEPWICCDDALMRAEPGDVVLGARVLMHALGAEACVIAVEDDKPEAIEALQTALRTAADGIVIEVVPAIYPRGAERQLITEVFDVEVPSRGLPADVGITCQNVATAAAVARWARTGDPCVSRVVTVTGSGVARPGNLRVALGTPLAALVASAGGYRGEPVRLIAGGNMTGRALPSDDVSLGKAINCVFVATRDDLQSRLHAFELPCIRCGDCAEVCPPGLLPQQIHRAALAGVDDLAARLGVWDCIDCGCCDYVCPSQIPLALRFRESRARLRELEAAAARAAAARERYERHERRLEEAALAERRAFDAARARARGSGEPGSTS